MLHIYVNFSNFIELWANFWAWPTWKTSAGNNYAINSGFWALFGQLFYSCLRKRKMRKFEGSSVTQFLNCSNRAEKWQVASVPPKTLQRKNLGQFEHFSQSYDYFCNLNLAIFESWNFALNKSSLFIHYQYWMVQMVLSMLCLILMYITEL